MPYRNEDGYKETMLNLEDIPTLIFYRYNLRDKSFEFVSRSFEEISGYKVEELFRKGVEFAKSIAHKDDINQIDKYFMRFSGNRFVPKPIMANTSSNFELRVRNAKGFWIWIELSLVLIEHGASNIALGFAKDITERKQFEKLLWKLIRTNTSPQTADIIKQEFNHYLVEPYGKQGNVLVQSKATSSHGPLEKITKRELEVVKLIGKGLSAKGIADHLNISIHTAISHRKNLISKFQVRNTAELMKQASGEYLL